MPKTQSDAASLPNAAETSALGRVLITAYMILSLAATLRAVYQIVAKFEEAPLAYLLSLVSGLVYIVATVALLKRVGVWRLVAWVALMFEFTGVLVIGTLSLTLPELFAHDSVWSHFGRGYLFIPLVLPLLGMIWLRRDADARRNGVRRSVSRGEAHQLDSTESRL